MSKKSITKSQVLHSALILLAVTLPYFLNNTSIGATLGEGLLAYVLKGVSWLLPACLCLRLPKIRLGTKARHRQTIYWMAFMLGAFQIVFMVAGGMYDRRFGKSPYLFTPVGIVTNLIVVSSTLIGTEISRSYFISVYSKRAASLVIALVSMVFTFTYLPLHKLLSLQSDLKMVEYAGKTILPSLAENTTASYLTYIGGPIASIAYRGVLHAFHWFSPVLPNSGVLTSALIGTIVPLMGTLIVHSIHSSEATGKRKHNKDKDSSLGWILSSVCSIVIVWFAVGIFPIYPSVVATGSMQPMIDPGDIILVKKIDSVLVQLGDVIQYKLDGHDITHRVIGIEDGETRRFKMQGDANLVPDSKMVEPSQIRGKIIGRVPKVGWITLVLRGGVKDSGARTF